MADVNMSMHSSEREVFSQSSVAVAPLLLGATLTHVTVDGSVSVRITEVEAYVGDGVDPGSHAYRGQTKRNSAMYGPPAHLYTYFTYGMHVCANVVCSPLGTASAVLLRAGAVVDGIELARARRTTTVRDRDLAQGPARLVVALGIRLDEGGADLMAPPFALGLAANPSDHVVRSGPRTGVSGRGGSDEFAWRFWLADDPTVSSYRRHPKAHD